MPNVIAALSNMGGALSSMPQSLADPAAGLPRSNAANIGERKTWTQSEFCTRQNSVRKEEPPKMYMLYQNVYVVPVQETTKHHAKFGWPTVSAVATVTKPRRETR